MFRVPPPCRRTRSGGNNGLTMSHSPSGTIQLHPELPMADQQAHHHVGHGLRRTGHAKMDHAATMVTFSVQASPVRADSWLRLARRCEAAGFKALLAPDHP